MQSKVAMFDFAYEISKRKFIYTHQVSCFIYINVKEFLKQFGTKRCQSSDDKDFHSSSKNNENKSRIFCLQLHNNKVHFFFGHINQISSKKRGKETFFFFVPKARGIWGDVLCFCQNFLLPCIFSVNYSELLKSSPSASYHNLYFLNRNKLVKLSFNNLMVSIQ